MAFSRLGWAVHLVKTFIWHQFLVSVQAQKQILRLAVLAQDDGVKLAQDDRLGSRDDRLGSRDDRLGSRDDRLGSRDVVV